MATLVYRRVFHLARIIPFLGNKKKRLNNAGQGMLGKLLLDPSSWEPKVPPPKLPPPNK